MERLEPGHVQVLCASVERVANHPIRELSDCRRLAETWDCRPRNKQFDIPVNRRRVTIDFAPGQNSWSAYQMALAMGPVVVPLAQQESRHPRDREEHCVLRGDDSDPQVARMTLACSVWTVEFVKLCADGACRYEPAVRRGTEPPRPREGQRSPGGPRPGG